MLCTFSPRRAVLSLLAGGLLTGCVYQGSGVVRPAARGEGVEFAEIDGSVVRLELREGSEALGYLDGHIVQIEGGRVGGRVRVRRWSVVEGLSGMPVYVGVVVRTGGGAALVERRSGERWSLDATAAATLAPWIGKVVLVEGYATGPRELTATAWRPLDELPE